MNRTIRRVTQTLTWGVVSCGCAVAAALFVLAVEGCHHKALAQ